MADYAPTRRPIRHLVAHTVARSRGTSGSPPAIARACTAFAVAALFLALAPPAAALNLRTVQDPAAALATLFLFAIILAAILAPWIAPSDPYASNLRLRLSKARSPGRYTGLYPVRRSRTTKPDP